MLAAGLLAVAETLASLLVDLLDGPEVLRAQWETKWLTAMCTPAGGAAVV